MLFGLGHVGPEAGDRPVWDTRGIGVLEVEPTPSIMVTNDPADRSAPTDATSVESTATLIDQIKQGDPTAEERLVQRYLPALSRWAHGRLPGVARHLADTDDLVQVSLVKALRVVKGFEPVREGAFFAYLRKILQNQIRDELRKAARKPAADDPDEPIDIAPSPLEQAIGREKLRAYESALDRLPDRQQEAVVMRVELGLTHAEVAAAVGCPSANAARMMVSRALVRIAEMMDAT